MVRVDLGVRWGHPGKAPLIERLAARHNLGAARGVILDADIARLDARANLARLSGLSITGEAVQ